MSFIREAVTKMSSYIPGEKPQGDDYIILNANENPYPASERVREAIQSTVGRLNMYPETSSSEARYAAAEVYGVDPEEVIFGNSSDEMLKIICQACVSEGEKVVMFSPTFSFYKTLVSVQGGECIELPFNDDFSLPQLPDFSGVKVVFFPNPGAPSSIVYELDVIRGILDAAPDSLVVIDEAYADFDLNRHTAVSLLREYANLMVVKTLSKSYSLAGLRVGIGIGRKEVVCEFNKVRDYYNVGLLRQSAVPEALRDQAWLRQNCEKIIATREWFSREIANYAQRIFPSAANFVLVEFAEGVAGKLYTALKERKILVRYWDTPRLNNFLRISIGRDKDMQEVLRAIAEILPEL